MILFSSLGYNGGEMTKIDISTRTILKIIGIVLLFWFLWAIRDIMVLLFVVLILVAAFHPTVDLLENHKIPRFLSVILIYFVLALAFSFLIYLIVPPIITQVTELTHNLPYYSEKTNLVYSQVKDYLPALQNNLESVASNLSKFTNNAWAAGLSVFGGLIYFITAMVLTFYALLEKNSFDSIFLSLFPVNYKEKISGIFSKIGAKMGSWLRGQLLLCLIIAVLDFIVLMIVGVPYALVLAVLAGILEIIPNIGPVLGAVPAILIGLTISPWTAVVIAICFFGIQQLENHILVPKIMGKAVGLSPVIVIIALLIGGKLLGIGGAILAVPAATAIVVAITEWRKA